MRLFCRFLLNRIKALYLWKGIDPGCFFLAGGSLLNSVAPSGIIYQTRFGTFHYKSNQGTCEVPGGEGSTSVVDGGEDQWGHQHLFTKANFDVRERLVSEKMFLF